MLVVSLADIEPRIADVLRQRIRHPTNAPRNRASSAGDECVRRLVYRRIRGADARPHGEDLQSIFDVGRETESAVVRLLEEAGVPLLEREREYTWPELDLAGHIDGRIETEEGRQVIDIKSMSPNIYDSVSTTENLLASRRPWLRGYPAQMDLYIAMARRESGGSEHGAIIARNKVTGRVRIIPHVLDEARLDATVLKLHTVNDHVHRHTLPERVDPGLGLCEGCAWAHVCLPDSPPITPLVLTIDSEFLSALDRRAALKTAADEYRLLDEELKGRVKATFAGEVKAEMVAGQYHIAVRTVKRRPYTVAGCEFQTVTITHMKGDNDGHAD